MSDVFGSLSATFGFGFTDDAREMVFDEDANKGVTPEFLLTPEPDIERAKAEGRPCYRDRETVLLHVSGDPLNTVSAPVDEKIKRRFPEQYKRWSENRSQSITVSGTPLAQWPVIGPSHVRELEALRIYNVEGLAEVADVHLSRSPSLRELRAKAVAWLASAKDNAEVVRMASELEKRDAMLAEMGERLKALEAREGEPKKGRPAKHQDEAA